jgi:hypothetical protein
LFCPPGQPTEIIEVHSKEAIAWTDDIVSLNGHFKLINNAEKGIYFELLDAEKTR